MRMDVSQPGMFGKWANIPITLDAGKPLMKGVGRSLLNDFCCSRSAMGGIMEMTGVIWRESLESLIYGMAVRKKVADKTQCRTDLSLT